ncbi:hypothetical protein BH09DEP1_BH09DEP1_1000 [soil metagenome]
MKLIFIIFGCLPSFVISMDSPNQLMFPLEENSPRTEDPANLEDFIQLQKRVGRLCKIVPKTISPDSDVKILRIHSAGEVDQLDCESINNLIRIECSQAVAILNSIATSNSVISSSVAQENYHYARSRYQNALHHIIQAFALKCYKTMDKLHQVLDAFIEAEQMAQQMNISKKLDQKTQSLYHPLEKIILKAEAKGLPSRGSITVDNTKELVKSLAVPTIKSTGVKLSASKSIENGNTHLKAGQQLLQNIQDPTLESLNNIEITFFLALEHFITAYYRDINQGLEEAEAALNEIEAVHTLKKNKFGKESQRYILAKEKLQNAKDLEAQKIPNHDDSNASSEYSLGKFLQDDATIDKTAASATDAPPVIVPIVKAGELLDSARSGERTINESERATVEVPETPRFSLFKSAWENCKKAGKSPYTGIKYLWRKLPFNRSDY